MHEAPPDLPQEPPTPMSLSHPPSRLGQLSSLHTHPSAIAAFAQPLASVSGSEGGALGALGGHDKDTGQGGLFFTHSGRASPATTALRSAGAGAGAGGSGSQLLGAGALKSPLGDASRQARRGAPRVWEEVGGKGGSGGGGSGGGGQGLGGHSRDGALLEMVSKMAGMHDYLPQMAGGAAAAMLGGVGAGEWLAASEGRGGGGGDAKGHGEGMERRDGAAGVMGAWGMPMAGAGGPKVTWEMGGRWWGCCIIGSEICMEV